MVAKKPQLVPLEVPWMVSPSTPRLELHCFEMSSSGDSYVQFVAYNKLLDEDTVQVPGASVAIASDPPKFHTAKPGERGANQLVRLQFSGTTAAKMESSFKEFEIIDASQFDCSLLPNYGKNGESDDISVFLEQQNQIWVRTGICSNPRAYEVLTQDSQMRSTLSADAYIERRFLVLGHDCFVDVTASAIAIQLGPVLAGW